MEFSFGLSGLVFSYNDYYSCNILISYSKLIMIKNNFFTLIIINIKDNFPLEKKLLLKKETSVTQATAINCYHLITMGLNYFRHIPVFHKGTILTCE